MIVFNSMEVETGFLFVRLVDDFLLVTPDSNIYDQVHNILSGKYLRAMELLLIKIKQSLLIKQPRKPSIDFVGLEVNTTDLSIKRNSGLISLVTTNFRTFKTLVKYLKTFYQLNLEGFLDCSFGVLENVLENMGSLLRLVLRNSKQSLPPLSI